MRAAVVVVAVVMMVLVAAVGGELMSKFYRKVTRDFVHWTHEFPAHSEIRCSTACNHEEFCEGFGFHEEEKVCRLFNADSVPTSTKEESSHNDGFIAYWTEDNMLVNISNGRPRHCKDLLDSGDSNSGLRQVYPFHDQPHHSESVFCEQEIDGGGWTVFQRRSNDEIRQNFDRNWAAYRTGFGNPNGEFWLGLDILHELTLTEQELRVDLDDYEGGHRWAKYGIFRVGSLETNYRLTLGRYSGDAGDSMELHNGYPFSTYDADHDKADWNCAAKHKGGWWYNLCHNVNLNGYQDVGSNTEDNRGIVWSSWRAWDYSLRRTEMMIRPTL